METENKIWVVVAVLTTILVGIGIYLFNLDRKLTKMERKMKEEKK
jgi:CcmD family protein